MPGPLMDRIDMLVQVPEVAKSVLRPAVDMVNRKKIEPRFVSVSLLPENGKWRERVKRMIC
ncbi:MAG: hypothetical protein OEW63_03750 [Gammaproteobacteria bacterium]|nr:hypothetical protein [Gammaproteobacteria bacterium]